MRTTIQLLGAGTLAASLLACSGDKSDGIGQSLDAAANTPRDAGTQAEDASSEELDAAASDDAELDAAPDEPAEDAAAPEDAETDALDPPSPDDAGGPENMVYASFAGALVRIDPETAELYEIGLLRNSADVSQVFTDVVLAWSGGATALMITSYYQTPTLATVDLCTGLVTLGPAISRTPNTNLVVEGLALAEDDTIYVASGNPATVNSPVSNHLGTLDRTTGAITDLSTTTIVAAQNDADMLFFAGETLYGVDVLTTNNELDLFTLDLGTGASTRVISPTPRYGGATTVPLRVAYDAGRGKAYAWRLSDQNLLELSLTTGVATAIGQTHAAGTYRIGGVDQPTRGFFMAPTPLCD